jgi:aromatic-L-amino-acid/L-tryptophan decarboxylase
MSMKEQGVARIGAAIQANIDQGRHLAGRIEKELRLELLAPVSLNTVCFRYADGSVPDERLDALNQEILTELQVRGKRSTASWLKMGNWCDGSNRGLCIGRAGCKSPAGYDVTV